MLFFLVWMRGCVFDFLYGVLTSSFFFLIETESNLNLICSYFVISCNHRVIFEKSPVFLLSCSGPFHSILKQFSDIR